MPKEAPVQEPEFCSLQTAARRYDCSVKLLRRLIAAGDLPAIKIGTRPPGRLRDVRPIRVRVADVESLMHAVVGAP